ncbi:serine hydrolase [Hymenobacter volaticus]|uniref:Serine hydrolase n=1 Tax=Hymenobacter volaticus TaxID=2932254 RepID=A0ABY4G0P2_9BACT|nr:serine hydrolase [Hymenobacter volaticus]UOQ64249.1 serine hydrolase [Hymenobacter volaticus]
MLKAFQLLLLCLCGLFSVNFSYGQTNSKTVELDSLLKRAHRLGVFNGNVLVAEQGKIIYQQALGQADARPENRLTEACRFHIGSISKEFNAVGIMVLQEQGKLRLEDPISRYLPELPAWAGQVQIRHLLRYTSGVPQSNWREVKGDADNMQRLKQITALDFTPGAKYVYNLNDVYLQRQIIEKITGMSFNDFVQKKLLKPCGIKSGIVDPTAADKLVARAYNNQGVVDELFYPFAGWTALNIHDFYRWSEGINSFKLISPASTQELLQPFARGSQTGLGGGKMEGGRIVSHVHDGTSGNYQALLVSTPPSGTTILLQTNNKQNNLHDIAEIIQALLDGKPYSPITKSFLSTFQRDFEKMDGQQVLALYEKVKNETPTLYGFNKEELLNETGYYLLGQKRPADAVMIFEYNAKLFPTSGNAFDSLGEAYYRQGNKEKALEKYTQALKLSPGLGSAQKMVAELQK